MAKVKAQNNTEGAPKKESRPKKLQGVVTSDKMTNTVVVEVQRYFKHPKYGKYIKSRKRYKAHDADNSLKIGDKVEITECRPMSKEKHFIAAKII